MQLTAGQVSVNFGHNNKASLDWTAQDLTRSLLREYALKMCQLDRICLVMLAVIYIRVCRPIVFLVLAVISKWLLVGKLCPGPILSDYQVGCQNKGPFALTCCMFGLLKCPLDHSTGG